MKKIIAAFVAFSLISTPAVAQHRNNHYRGYERHDTYNRHNRDRGVSTGEAVAIGLGALILGAAIANSNNRNTTRVERYEQPVQRRQSQYVCQDVVQYDYYGNPYVSGRNCWYQ